MLRCGVVPRKRPPSLFLCVRFLHRAFAAFSSSGGAAFAFASRRRAEHDRCSTGNREYLGGAFDDDHVAWLQTRFDNPLLLASTSTHSPTVTGRGNATSACRPAIYR